jgi:hypothetical protein
MKNGIASCNSCIYFWPPLFLLVFIVLKLVGLISWSWWWVLSPLFLVFGVIVLCTLAVVGLYLYDAYLTEHDTSYKALKLMNSYLRRLGKK